MRVAIPHWQGRISPVFDVAGRALLVDVDDGGRQAREDLVLPAESARARISLLVSRNVSVLVCGAISWPLEAALQAAGIEVISHICGDVEQVLAAFLEDRLGQDAFLMPGCCEPRRRSRMGRRHGRMGGAFAAGPGGQCVCPGCGHSAPHVQGQPCNRQTCPQCGMNMTRD